MHVCGMHDVCVCVCVCVHAHACVLRCTTHKVSIKAPLVSGDVVLDQVVGTTGDSVHGVVTAHDAAGISFLDTCFKCGEIGLFWTEHMVRDRDRHA